MNENDRAYGWWPQLVLDAFSFLPKIGYMVADVHYHQEGNFVRFHGRKGDVYVEYDPDSSVASSSVLFSDSNRMVSLERLADGKRGAQPVHVTRETAPVVLKNWARILESLSRDVL